MSTPEGPDQPPEVDPAAPPQQPYQQQPYQPQGAPPVYPPQQRYPPPQYEPPQQYPAQQYSDQQYGPQQYGPQQYGPSGYQPPPPGQQQPYGQPWYGQQPQGDYPQYAPPNRSATRTPLVLAAVAVVVVALAVVSIVLLTNRNGTKTDAQRPPATASAPARSQSTSGSSPSPSTSSAATSPPASQPTSLTPTSVRQITVPPVISGWHGVLSYKENVAYDVPPGWKVETPGTLVGFETNNGKPIAIMHGVSTYKNDACPKVAGSYRGHTGFATAGDLDPTVAARGGVKIFADGAALKSNGSSAPVSSTKLTDITVDQGKIHAKFARATVALKDNADCGSPSVVVFAVAFRSRANATALFIGYFDQGVPDSLSLTTMKRIFTTLRPYHR